MSIHRLEANYAFKSGSIMSGINRAYALIRKRPYRRAPYGGSAMVRRPPGRMAPSMFAGARIVPGFTRTGGSYGRYGASASRMGLKPELKFFDTALAFNFDLTGEVPATGQLALIPQGDTESTRDGRVAYIKSVQIRGNIIFNAVAGGQTVSSSAVYLYLVLDTQCNGAAAAITDVFTSNVMGSNMLNLNNSSRFRIIKKWEITLNSMAGVSTNWGVITKLVNFYKRCNIKMDWSSTTGAITEIRSNNLFLCAGALNNDDIAVFDGTCRLRFMG